MGKRQINELKILGINPFLISAAVVASFGLLAYIGGELLNLSYMGFEVILPFYSAIAVSEWAKVRTDANYDIIAAQSKSLFAWVLRRFLTVFCIVALFALLGTVIVSLIRGEMPWHEILLLYLAPAFFLSTVSILCSFLFRHEHISILICGVIWLLEMLTRSMLRYPGYQYVYLFIRFAGDQNDIWLTNKLILIGISLILWAMLYFLCKKKR